MGGWGHLEKVLTVSLGGMKHLVTECEESVLPTPYSLSNNSCLLSCGHDGSRQIEQRKSVCNSHVMIEHLLTFTDSDGVLCIVFVPSLY